MIDRPRLLYLLAPSYSGSTLLTYLLSQHPSIATVGELKATRMGDVSQYHCSCGANIRECGFWKQLRELVAKKGMEFSVDNFNTVFGSANVFFDRVIKAGVRGPMFECLRSAVLAVTPESVGRLRDVAQRNLVLGRAICEIQGGSIFLDGSKDPARLMHFQHSRCWEVYVIYLQRDGRGVSNSYRNHDGRSYADAVDYWRHTVRELGWMRSRVDENRVFDLKYELLCREPARVMSDIWSWLEIESQPLRELETTSGKSHILGNRMRLRNVSEIRCDEAWRLQLPRADLDLFERKAGDVNRSLGYE